MGLHDKTRKGKKVDQEKKMKMETTEENSKRGGGFQHSNEWSCHFLRGLDKNHKRFGASGLLIETIEKSNSYTDFEQNINAKSGLRSWYVKCDMWYDILTSCLGTIGNISPYLES